MRVLLVHNFYNSLTPSGENQVFLAEKKLLEDQGAVIDSFTATSDTLLEQGALGKLQGALITPWNLKAAGRLREKVAAFKPDIVHVHNTFPLLSPSIFSAVAGRAGVVLTLHNYRLFCAAAIPMREGQICTACLDQRSVMPALWHGCYRSSRVATLPLAVGIAMHRALGTWQKHIDKFICLSRFQRDRMIEAGLPADRIAIKPNFYPGSPKVRPWGEREPAISFVGRLSPEKGVETLLRAWRLWGATAPKLRIVGDGPLRNKLEELAHGLPVEFLGQMPAGKAQEQISASRLLILPSECFEGFPMVIREAFAFGTPAAVSNLGPLPSIVTVQSGVVFRAGDPDALLTSVRNVWENPARLEKLGGGARREFEAKYTEQANYQQLMAIYRESCLREGSHG